MVFCPGSIDRKGGRQVIRIVLKCDPLGIGKGQFFHTLENFIILIFFALSESVSVSSFRSRRIVVAAAQENKSGKKGQAYIQFHFFVP